MVDPIKEKLRQEGINRDSYSSETNNEKILEKLKGESTTTPANLAIVPVKTRDSTVSSLYGARGTTLVGFDIECTYDNLDNIIIKINQQDRDFQNIMRYKHSTLYKLVLCVMHKQPNITEYQIFENQVVNIATLTNILDGMVRRSEPKVKELKRNVIDLTYQLEKDYQSINSLKEVSLKTANQHKEIRELFEASIQNDPEYFSKLRELFISEDKINETMYNFTENQKNIIYNKEELKRLIFLYELMNISLTTVKQIQSSAIRMQNSLWVTRDAYPTIEFLRRCSTELNKSLQILSNYNKDLNRNFVDGIKSMTQILDRDQGMTLLEQSNTEYGGLIRDIRTIDYKRDLMLEERLSTS